MAITFSSGQRLTASMLQQLVPLRATLTGDVTLTPSSTTLQDVTGMAVTPATNTTYELEGVIFYDTSGTPDIKLAFTYPSGATFSWGPAGLKFDGTDFQSHFTAVHREVSATSTPVAGLGSGTEVTVHIQGKLVMGGTAGSLQLQAAQNTSNASNTIVKSDSWMRLWKT